MRTKTYFDGVEIKRGCGIKRDLLYFPVRESDGVEWIDISSWGYVAQTAKDKAEGTDSVIPIWANDNQVVRIAQFRLSEIV